MTAARGTGVGADGAGGPTGHDGPGSAAASVWPETYREETLAAVPTLGTLYARAIGRSRAAVMSSHPLAGGGLPEVVLRVDGATPDAERLTAYQHLLGEPGTDELPAGYVHVLGFPLAMAVMVRADFPLPVLGMVHIANRVVQRRPLVLGETFTLRAWAQSLAAHPRGTQVDLVVGVTVGEEEVWSGTSTYLAKGRRPDGDPAPTVTGTGTDTDTDTDTTIAAATGVVASSSTTAAPGVVAGRWTLPADAGRAYAAVSGDRNPIHVSRLGARLFGFPRPIAHGMYTAARALAATRRIRGPFEWTAQFAKPVLLPGDVTLTLAERPGPTGAAGTAYTLTGTRSGRLHLTGAIHPLTWD